MGKFVILPSHPSNDFFSQFPNCLTYANKEEFVGKCLSNFQIDENNMKDTHLCNQIISVFCSGNLYYALTHSPEPLSEEYSHALSWEAANDRFAAAGCISVAESEELNLALERVENGIEVSFAFN